MSTRILLLPIFTMFLLIAACPPITPEITATKAFPENNTAPFEKVLAVLISDNLPGCSLFEQEMKKTGEAMCKSHKIISSSARRGQNRQGSLCFFFPEVLTAIVNSIIKGLGNLHNTDPVWFLESLWIEYIT